MSTLELIQEALAVCDEIEKRAHKTYLRRTLAERDVPALVAVMKAWLQSAIPSAELGTPYESVIEESLGGARMIDALRQFIERYGKEQS